MRILMVLTSHDQLGTTGRKTGLWLEEFAAPYYVFRDAGASVTLASPLGGQPPLDPKSDEPGAATPAIRRFRADPEAQAALAHTRVLASVKADDYNAVFYPGGHGPLWDLAEDPLSIELIQHFWRVGKPVAAICHAPGVLRHVRDQHGELIVRGRRVTGFSNSEEMAAELTHVVPFLVEDMLIAAGGEYDKSPDWQSHVVIDRPLITGQNPASSEAAAVAVLRLLT